MLFNVWKIEISEGTRVEKGDSLVVVESMKMEINIEASTSGTVEKIVCSEGAPVSNGQTLCIIRN